MLIPDTGETLFIKIPSYNAMSSQLVWEALFLTIPTQLIVQLDIKVFSAVIAFTTNLKEYSTCEAEQLNAQHAPAQLTEHLK